jgi:hypothetical protein
MSYLYGFTYQDPTTNFLTTIIGQFKKILAVVPAGSFGGSLTVGLNYKAAATVTDSVVLNFKGLVDFVYIKIYGTLVPDNPTPIEKEQIYSIYDALKVARPIL